MNHLALRQPGDEKTWDLIRGAATKDPSIKVRENAIALLGRSKKDWQLVVEAAKSGDHSSIRVTALRTLAEHAEGDREAFDTILRAAEKDPDRMNRRYSMRLLLERRGAAAETWEVISALANADPDPDVRFEAVRHLVGVRAQDERTKVTVRQFMTKHPSPSDRGVCFLSGSAEDFCR